MYPVLGSKKKPSDEKKKTEQIKEQAVTKPAKATRPRHEPFNLMDSTPSSSPAPTSFEYEFSLECARAN